MEPKPGKDLNSTELEQEPIQSLLKTRLTVQNLSDTRRGVRRATNSNKSVRKIPSDKQRYIRARSALLVLKNYWKFIFAFSFSILLLFSLSPFLFSRNRKNQQLGAGIYTVVLIVTLWITETLPVAVTSLIPIFTGPLFGMIGSNAISKNYFGDIIFLFFTGVTVAMSFEFSNLHKRFGLKMILCTGTSPKMLLLGIMVTTSVLSMFMNNTSTTALMCPIVVALVESIEGSIRSYVEEKPKQPGKNKIIKPAIGKRKENNVINPAVPKKETLIQSLDVKPTPQNKIPNEVLNDDENGSIPLHSTFSELSLSSITSAKDGRCSNVLSQELGEKEKKASESRKKEMEEYLRNLKIMLLLGTSYSSNLAGTGMITGTGTNMILLEEAEEFKVGFKNDGEESDLSMLTWAMFAMPSMILNLIFCYFFLLFYFLYLQILFNLCRRKRRNRFVVSRGIREAMLKALAGDYKKLGKISLHEIEVLIIFIIMILLWIFQEPHVFPGWAQYTNKTAKASLATPAILATVVMFVIPRNPEFFRKIFRGHYRTAKFDTVMEWTYLQNNFRWGVIFLLGGGLAMTKIAEHGGLISELTDFLKRMHDLDLNPYIVLLIVVYMVVYLTEVIDNVPTAATILPVLFGYSRKFKIHPFFLTFPATIAASHAFMLPVSTIPNAIVFSAGQMKMMDMFIPGMWMNIFTGIILYGSSVLMGNLVFGYSHYEFKGCLTKSDNYSTCKGGDFFDF